MPQFDILYKDVTIDCDFFKKALSFASKNFEFQEGTTKRRNVNVLDIDTSMVIMHNSRTWNMLVTPERLIYEYRKNGDTITIKIQYNRMKNTISLDEYTNIKAETPHHIICDIDKLRKFYLNFEGA